jgi:hypothetical protein
MTILAGGPWHVGASRQTAKSYFAVQVLAAVFTYKQCGGILRVQSKKQTAFAGVQTYGVCGLWAAVRGCPFDVNECNGDFSPTETSV